LRPPVAVASAVYRTSFNCAMTCLRVGATIPARVPARGRGDTRMSAGRRAQTPDQRREQEPEGTGDRQRAVQPPSITNDEPLEKEAGGLHR
jgi:hypothetical protein